MPRVLLFLPAPRLSAWLPLDPAEGGAPGEVARRAREGALRLPPRLNATGNPVYLPLEAICLGEVVILFPAGPARAAGWLRCVPPPAADPGGERLRLLYEHGRHVRYIAYVMRHSPRWVYYQKRRLKIGAGVGGKRQRLPRQGGVF